MPPLYECPFCPFICEDWKGIGDHINSTHRALMEKAMLVFRKKLAEENTIRIPWDDQSCTLTKLMCFGEAYCDGDAKVWVIPLGKAAASPDRHFTILAAAPDKVLP